MRAVGYVPGASKAPAAKRIVKGLVGGALLGCLASGGAAAAPAGEPVIVMDAGIGAEAIFEVNRRTYCEQNHYDPVCHAVALTRQRADELHAVQDALRRIPRRDDRDLYGRGEYWRVADMRGGDCEDIALAARAKLLALGWPVEALRLATAWTEQRMHHLVLTIDMIAGDRIETVVLDSRFRDVERYDHLVEIGYRFETRQAAGGAYWAHINDPHKSASLPAGQYASFLRPTAEPPVEAAALGPAADVLASPGGDCLKLDFAQTEPAPLSNWSPSTVALTPRDSAAAVAIRPVVMRLAGQGAAARGEPPVASKQTSFSVARSVTGAAGRSELSVCEGKQRPVRHLGMPLAMADGAIAAPPAGWLDFCRRNRSDPSCSN